MDDSQIVEAEDSEDVKPEKKISAYHPKSNHTEQSEKYGVKKQTHKFFAEFQNDWDEENYNHSIFDGKQFTHKNGQRKLLISEIYFFQQFYDGLVVYVGSAPWTHGPLLCEMFPKLNFNLYDPRDHDDNLEPYIKQKRLKIFKQFFTDEDCKQYIGQDVIFVSDIRNMDDYKEKNQNVVEEDMYRQMRWVQIIQPRCYFLKFKLNYMKDTQQYLPGKIYIQSWTNPWSIETRLLGTAEQAKQLKDYDCKQYERKMFFFNKYIRFNDTQLEKQNVYPEIYCTCHDCIGECNVLNEYLRKKLSNLTIGNIQDRIGKVMIIKEKINEVNKATQGE